MSLRSSSSFRPFFVVDIGLRLDYGYEDDSLSGFDRFGRVSKQQWTTSAGRTVELDRHDYVYDRTGNVLRETLNVGTTANDDAMAEVYVYDGLDRLVTLKRGAVDSTGLDVDYYASTYYEVWLLTLQGNWYDHYYDKDGAVSSGFFRETYESTTLGNQIASINHTEAGTDAVDPLYDDAGNMTRVPGGESLETALYYRRD